jgi:hypothetical protein
VSYCAFREREGRFGLVGRYLGSLGCFRLGGLVGFRWLDLFAFVVIGGDFRLGWFGLFRFGRFDLFAFIVIGIDFGLGWFGLFGLGRFDFFAFIVIGVDFRF